MIMLWGELRASPGKYIVPERVDTIDAIIQLCSYTIEGLAEYATESIAYAQKGLDAIIAVGYCINSTQAMQFRIWATQTLKEFITKGFVLDDERLKQGKIFSKDYFDELLERI